MIFPKIKVKPKHQINYNIHPGTSTLCTLYEVLGLNEAVFFLFYIVVVG